MLRLATNLILAASAAVAFGVVAAPAVAAEEAAPERVAAPEQAWSYNIRPSCGGWEGIIRQGANYWGDVTEGGGTPVECQNSAITDCGFLAEPVEMLDVDGQLIVVGCNYGMGQLIKLFPGAVNDPALLAAHEFGHNWYGHSYDGCASWASPEAVMATTMC
jgi:hypothetical protein